MGKGCLGLFSVIGGHSTVCLYDTLCRTASWMTAIADTQLICHTLVKEEGFSFSGKGIVNGAALPLSRQLAVRGGSPRAELARTQKMPVGIGQIFIKSTIIFLIAPVVTQILSSGASPFPEVIGPCNGFIIVACATGLFGAVCRPLHVHSAIGCLDRIIGIQLILNRVPVSV